MRFSTKAIHVGSEPEVSTGAIITPIFQTSTFAQSGLGEQHGFAYSRTQNPTRAALEACIAALEDGPYGLAFASGMAAESAILSLLRAGDHLVACDDLYGRSYRLFEQVLRRYNVEASYVPVGIVEAYEQAIQPNTKILWLETPTNPLLRLSDISAIADMAHRHKVLVVVDNTLASPYFQQPLGLGADIVSHSTTKYLNGHDDLIGGVVVMNNPEIY
jgi:cystathionine gamma-lyase